MKFRKKQSGAGISSLFPFGFTEPNGETEKVRRAPAGCRILARCDGNKRM